MADPKKPSGIDTQKLLTEPKSRQFYFYENWLGIISKWKRKDDAVKEGNRLLASISQSHKDKEISKDEAIELITRVRKWGHTLKARHESGEFARAKEPPNAGERRTAPPVQKFDTPRGYFVPKALQIADAKAAKPVEQMTIADFRDWLSALNALERNKDRVFFIEFFLKVEAGVKNGKISKDEAGALEAVLRQKDDRLRKHAESETARLTALERAKSEAGERRLSESG